MIIDGATFCDRCEQPLDGYGVINGMILSHLDDGEVKELIFCYANDCRDIVIMNMLNGDSDGRTRCSTCGELITGITDAALGSDLTEGMIAFCYRQGHRDRVVDQGEL